MANIYNDAFYSHLTWDTDRLLPKEIIAAESTKEEVKDFQDYIKGVFEKAPRTDNQDDIIVYMMGRLQKSQKNPKESGYQTQIPHICENIQLYVLDCVRNPNKVHSEIKELRDLLTQSNRGKNYLKATDIPNPLMAPVKKWLKDKFGLVLDKPLELTENPPLSIDTIDKLTAFREKFGFNQVIVENALSDEKIQKWISSMDNTLSETYGDLGLPTQMAGLNGKVTLSYTPAAINTRGLGGYFINPLDSNPLIAMSDSEPAKMKSLWVHETTHLLDYLKGKANIALEPDTNARRAMKEYYSHQILDNLLDGKLPSDNIAEKGMTTIMSQIIGGTSPEQFLKKQIEAKEQLQTETQNILSIALLPYVESSKVEKFVQSEAANNFITDILQTTLAVGNADTFKSKKTAYKNLLKTLETDLQLPKSVTKQMENDLPNSLGFIVEAIQYTGKNLGYVVDNIKQHNTEFFAQSTLAKNSLDDGWRLDENFGNHEIKFTLARPLELIGRWTETMALGRENTPTSYPAGNLDEIMVGANYPTRLAEKQETMLKDNFFNLVQMVNNHYQFAEPINGGQYRDVLADKTVLDTPKQKTVTNIELLRAKFNIGSKNEATLKLG